MNPGSVENFVAAMLYIGKGMCVMLALGYLLGRLSCLVRKKREKKPYYNFVVGFPLVSVSCLWIYSYNRHVVNCALISLAAWLVAVACAIIREKVQSYFKRRKKKWEDDGKKRVEPGSTRITK